MCRVLSYLGSPVSLTDILYEPDSSLVKQTYEPQMGRRLNLAGFGMTAWQSSSHKPEHPFVYRTDGLAVFDRNLHALADKLRPHALLAHLRGVAYNDRVEIGPQNVHPFLYEGVHLAVAHNGNLAHFGEMKFDLLKHIKPEIARRIAGTTDTEWVYAVLLSRFKNVEEPQSLQAIVDAVADTLRILREVRAQNSIHHTSEMNLFVIDGRNLVATRFTFDYGCTDGPIEPNNLEYTSLWYTTGRSYGFHDGEWKMIGGEPDSIIVASEPLTRDISTWIEAPEYSLLAISRTEQKLSVRTVPLEL